MALVVSIDDFEAVWDGKQWASDDEFVLDTLVMLTDLYRLGSPPFVGYIEDPNQRLGHWLK
jgi:hypothetical protein